MTIDPSYLASGIVFGFAAGIAPGPLLTLVFTETIKYGYHEGFKVAVSPLLTDLPIIVACLLLVNYLSSFDALYGVLSLLGGSFLCYLAYENLVIQPPESLNIETAPQSLKKGSVVNLLNPHPYLFWLTIGGGMLLKSYEISLLSSVAFLTGFYVCLVGSKITLAYLCERSKTFLQKRAYRITLRVLGLVLLIFALIFFVDGISYLGFL